MRTTENQDGQEDTTISTNWILSFADRILNPVSGIEAALDIMKRDLDANYQSLPPLTTVSMDKIREGLASIETFIRELMDFANEPQLVVAPCRLTDLLNEAVTATAKVTRTKPMTVRNFDEDMTIVADRTKTVAILTSLLTNAVEATSRPEHPTVEISTEASQAGTIIHLDDEGSGLTQHELDRLFTPFFSTKIARTGIGLALVKRYMMAHGGFIKVENRASGKGTRATLFFPKTNGMWT